MKFLSCLLAVFLVANYAFADDPGMRDSIIVETVYVPYGETSCHVPIYALTDENVAFYNVPLNWQPVDSAITPSGVYYYNYLFHWSVFDDILYDENIIRMYGFYNGSNYLNTYGNRLITWSILFIIDSTAPPQIIAIDTTYDMVAGSISLGFPDGSQFTPAFSPGFIYYGNTAEVSETGLQQPSIFADIQNYPNPFNAATTIRFDLSESKNVTLTVYDILGRQIKTLIDKYLEAGKHSIPFHAAGLASGIYFARLESNNATETVRMLLLR